MENDEKRKKVVEDYFDSVDDSSKDSDPYGYVIHKTWYQLIDTALNFAKDIFFEHNECDYSTDESYRESIDEYCEKSPSLILMTYRIVNGNFCYIIIYIGKVINDINNNYYPNGYSEIFNELEDW